jgi:hypothetical protein
MITKRIPIAGEREHFNLMSVGEFEYANPIEKMGSVFMQMHMNTGRSFIDLKPEIFEGCEEDRI